MFTFLIVYKLEIFQLREENENFKNSVPSSQPCVSMLFHWQQAHWE
jgi:hypothetical protein